MTTPDSDTGNVLSRMHSSQTRNRPPNPLKGELNIAFNGFDDIVYFV